MVEDKAKEILINPGSKYSIKIALKKGGILMVILEIKQSDQNIIDEITSTVSYETIEVVDSLGGNDIVHILVPIVTAMATFTVPVIKKWIDSKKVKIIVDGVEISVYGAETAMKLLQKAFDLKNTNKDNTIEDSEDA